MTARRRQELIQGWNQEAVKAVSVAVIGAGAIGGSVVLQLARLGIGHIDVYDPDVLESHNVFNQVYNRQDIGLAKVAALEQYVRAIDPDIKFQAVKARVQDKSPKIEATHVLGCLDNVAARYFLNGYAVAKNKVYIDAGIRNHFGTVQTIVPKKTACLSCYPFLPKQTLKASCSTDPVPSTVIIANAIASVQVMQLVKLIHEWPWSHHVSFDLLNGKCFANDFSRNAQCETCGEVEDVELPRELIGVD